VLAVRAEKTTSLPAEDTDIASHDEHVFVSHNRGGCALAREVGLPGRLAGLGVEFV